MVLREAAIVLHKTTQSGDLMQLHPSEMFAPEEKAGSQIEEAYRRLREEILLGKLPPGEKLRIDFLRRTYQFGASGLREALSRLLADGLVESEAQRGFWVSPISREDLYEITNMRKVIEVEALRRAIRHGKLDWETRVVGARYALERFELSMTDNSPDVVMAWERANRQFHMTLISGCPLRRLLRYTEQLYDQSQRYRHRTVLRRTVPRSGLSKDHVELVEATLTRNDRRACALLADHIEVTSRIADKAIFGE
jgi:GntR family transcriptional regulator, carbon starvation induced regulator